MKKYKKQIYLFLSISLLVVIGSFAFLFFNFRKQMHLQNEIERIEKRIILADSLSNNLLQIESDKRGFQLTGDLSYLKNIYNLKVSTARISEAIGKNIISKANVSVIPKIDSILILRLSKIDSGIIIFTTRGFEESIAYMQLKSNTDARELLSQYLDTVKINLQSLWNENSSIIKKKSKQNITDLLILLVAAVIMMFVTANVIKKSQQRIIRNHFKFKEAQRIAKIGSWEWNFATNKLRWSQEQYRLFGEDRKTFESTYDGYLLHLSRKEQDNFEGLVKEAVEGAGRFSVEHEITRGDGAVLTVFEQGTVLFDKNNKPTGMFGTSQDITERKKAETELILTKQKFQAIFDNTADGIYQSTIDGKFIMVNTSMATIFGYDSADDLIQSVSDISEQIYADPKERQRMADIILRQGHVEDFELQVLTKGNEKIWVSANIRIVRNDNGSINYFEGVLEDITDRKKAESQLLNMSNRLQLAIDATNIGIWDWNIEDNSTVWDEEMYRIYKIDTKDKRTITEAWEACIHPDDFEKVTEDLQLALKGEKEYDTEFRIIWNDRSIHYVKGNAIVQRDENGKPIRMIGTNADITQRKEAEEEILQLNQNLDQFANITAHDLQEPIRMVSGFLGLLEKKYSDVLDEQGKSYVFRAKDGADRMSILIRDLLEFSRSGNKAAKKESVDFANVIDLVKKDLSIVMQDTGAVLKLPEFLPVVTGTQSALYRLILNLVSNGIKFRKKDTVPEVTLCVKESPGFWEFALQDNGIGVAEKDQPKLFQAFQRLHRRDEYPGTGLGLVTCKKIVETHGGRIWMTSELGKGTGFHFTISKD